MTTNEVLSRFEGVKPQGESSWLVRCPVHDDRKQSLSITLKDEKILMYCHARCSTKAVLAAVDLKFEDLRVDDGKTLAKLKPQTIDSYEFTTTDGQKVYCDRQFPKGFRWRHICEGRTVSGLPKDAQVNIYMYELVESSNTPVYITEGVKDVKTLQELGFVATTTPNGGGKGKWKPHHSPPFQGKDVIICPDNDSPGREYAREAAIKLQGIAKSVKILRCWDVWPDLPDKGDITDLVEHLGENAKESILHATLYDSLADVDEYEEAFSNAPGYTLENGCIAEVFVHKGIEGTQKLCNFVALIEKESILDDGAETHMYFQIKGRTHEGRPLPTIMVSAGEFASGAWIPNLWGVRAAVNPNVAARGKLMHAIQLASLLGLCEERKFTCMGWREVNGKYVYLHGNGSIPNGDAIVELSRGLERYGLPDDAGDIVEAIQASASVLLQRSREQLPTDIQRVGKAAA